MIKLLSIGSFAVLSTLLTVMPSNNVEPQVLSETKTPTAIPADSNSDVDAEMTYKVEGDGTGEPVYTINGEVVDADQFEEQTVEFSDEEQVTATASGSGEQVFTETN